MLVCGPSVTGIANTLIGYCMHGKLFNYTRIAGPIGPRGTHNRHETRSGSSAAAHDHVPFATASHNMGGAFAVRPQPPPPRKAVVMRTLSPAPGEIPSRHAPPFPCPLPSLLPPPRPPTPHPRRHAARSSPRSPSRVSVRGALAIQGSASPLTPRHIMLRLRPRYEDALGDAPRALFAARRRASGAPPCSCVCARVAGGRVKRGGGCARAHSGRATAHTLSSAHGRCSPPRAHSSEY